MDRLRACWQWIQSTIFPDAVNRQFDDFGFIYRFDRETGELMLPLGEFFPGRALHHSIHEIVPAIQSIPALPSLTISLLGYFPPREQSDEDVLQFLLQYISSRKHIRKLTLRHADMDDDDVALAFRQFLTAVAKSETIHHLCFQYVMNLHTRDLSEFCRANRKIKVLQLSVVDFAGDQDPQSDDSESHLSMVPLDRIIIDVVVFRGRSAALAFADVASRLDIADIELDSLTCAFQDTGDECVKRIVSSLMQSATLNRLTLRMHCKRAPCVAALAAGANTVEELHFECGKLRESEIKFCRLIKSITEMDKLRVLHVTLFSFETNQKPKKRFFCAIDATATLTVFKIDEIDIEEIGNRNICFNQEEIQWMEGRVKRNKNLRRFVNNPDDFSDKEVLVLMLQLQNSHTGRLQLARALPVSFFGGAAPTNSMSLDTNEAQSTGRNGKLRRRIMDRCKIHKG